MRSVKGCAESVLERTRAVGGPELIHASPSDSLSLAATVCLPAKSHIGARTRNAQPSQEHGVRHMDKLTVSTAFIALSAFALAAHAGEGKGRSGQDEVRMMDTNGDGRLSPEEHAAGA